jgi:hypothetical protein
MNMGQVPFYSREPAKFIQWSHKGGKGFHLSMRRKKIPMGGIYEEFSRHPLFKETFLPGNKEDGRP